MFPNLREKMATRHRVKHVHRNTVCNTQHEDNQAVEVLIVDAYRAYIYIYLYIYIHTHKHIHVTSNDCMVERLNSHSTTTGGNAVTLKPFQIISLATVKKKGPLDRYMNFTAAVLHYYSTNNSDPLFSTIHKHNSVILF